MKTNDNHSLIVISGASRGLGREIVKLFCLAGKRVLGLARSLEQMNELSNWAANTPGSFEGFSLDVTDEEAIEKLYEQIYARGDRVDLVIGNAGIAVSGWAAKQTPQLVKRHIEVNFLGVVNLFLPIIPKMIEQKGGHLAAVSSIAGFRGLQALSAYAASKAALRSYLESLRIELRSKNIAVTTLSPGYIKTEMIAGSDRPMPFMMSVQKAAEICVRAINAKHSELVFPLPMALSTRVMMMLPNFVYDRLARLF